MKNSLTLLIVLLISVQLMGCGGGDRANNNDTGTIVVDHKTPDGIWHGSINTTDLANNAVTYDIDVIVSKDQLFATTSSKISSKVVVQDIYTGTVLLNSNTISGQILVFKSNGTTQSVSLSGNVSEQSILTGTINGSDSFSLTFDTNYDRPVKLTSLAGNWKIPQGTIAPPLTISGDQISGAVTASCQFQGTLIQPTPGKNAFITTTATLSDVVGATSSCAFPGNYSSMVTIEAAGRLTLFLTDISNNSLVLILTYVNDNTVIRFDLVS